MTFAVPSYPPDTVDFAGDCFAGYEEAYYPALGGVNVLEVINNWRSAHAYPLNNFQITLRKRTREIDPTGIVAQRIKRLASIEDKLKRYDWLKLSEMQDIAGCRVIVGNVDQVFDLVNSYKVKGYGRHLLDAESDYINKPKSDGYRGYHLIYRYTDRGTGAYSGLKIEMQFRSALQHSWATAVETADIFYREGLKSHRGSPDWRRFFALMGGALAMREECRPVPRTPRDQVELVRELREVSERLNVATRLKAFGDTINVVGELAGTRIKYVVLELDPQAGTTRLFGYRAGAIEEATAQYAALERHKKAGSGTDAVLVAVSDAANLRRAYPNYFLDTDAFLEALATATTA